VKLPEIWLDWSWSNGSSVTITSRIPADVNALGETTYTETVVYNGPANIYNDNGSIISDILGVIAAADYKVIIDGVLPLTNGRPTLPQGIEVGSVMTINGDQSHNSYLVQSVNYWDIYPFCLKLDCNLAKGG
jgi:hypothetical protein